MSDLDQNESGPDAVDVEAAEIEAHTQKAYPSIMPGERTGGEAGRGVSAPGLSTLRALATSLAQQGWFARVWEEPGEEQVFLPMCPSCGSKPTCIELVLGDVLDPTCGCSTDELMHAAETNARALVRTLAIRPDGLPWGEPRPLREGARPAFPTSTLPSPLGDVVREIARETQTPEDLVGMTVLGAVSALIGGRVKVRARGNWVEPTNLFVATALPPGERKSAVHRMVMAPVHEVEQQLVLDTVTERREAANRHDILERRLKALRRQASNEDDPQERDRLASEASACQQELEQVPSFVPPKLLADDVTPEALTSLLADQGGRMTVSSAEGGFIDIVAGRYSKNGEANLDVLLKAHAGDPIRVDRIGRESETVDNPALTLVLAFQPDVLRSMGERASFAARGVLARFLFAVPEPRVGSRQIAPEPANPGVLEQWRQLALVLGNRITAADDVVELSLEPDAERELRAFEEEVEPRLRQGGGDLAELATGWGGKLAGVIVRLAALLHLAQTFGEVKRHPRITLRAVQEAITLGRYLVDHARLAFGEMGASGEEAARAERVMRWVRKKGGGPFTERDVMNADVLGREGGRRLSSEPYQAALDLLVDRGWLFREELPPGPKGGRPPSPTYRVNPRTLETG